MYFVAQLLATNTKLSDVDLAKGFFNFGDIVLLQNEAVSAEPLVPLQIWQFLQLVRRKWICKQNLHIFQPPARFSKIMNQKI